MFLKKLSKSLVVTMTSFTLLYSCSHVSPNQIAENSKWEWNYSRSIANEKAMPASFDELLTFKSTGQVDKKVNAIQALEEYLKTLSYSYKGSAIKYELAVDTKMPSDEAFRIVPAVEDQAYKLKIFYSKGAVNDIDALNEISKFLQLSTNLRLPSTYAFFELAYNARAQDLTSLSVLSQLRYEALTDDVVTPHVYDNAGFFQRTKQYAEEWKSLNDKFKALEREKNKNDKVQALKRKEIMDALDKASDDKQFKTFIAKNDRKGAADLLKKYLPWEEMPPFEKLFWESYLDVMANPVGFEDRVLVFRGIDDDMIHEAIDGGKMLGKEEAFREQKIFVMSTIMTKNQGSWNRRLRSLTAMYEKTIATDDAGRSDVTRTARITTMFKKHSGDPVGSPFLSTTPKFSVAAGFGYNRNSAYFIDPRLLFFNYASGFENEIEFLLPLMTFPDDLAGAYDAKVFPNEVGNVEKFLEKKAIEKLDREVGKGQGSAVYKRIKLNSEKFFKPVMSGQVSGAVQAAPAAKPGGLTNFFKKLLGMDKKKVEEAITEKSDMQCTDLIQLFWK